MVDRLQKVLIYNFLFSYKMKKNVKVTRGIPIHSKQKFD